MQNHARGLMAALTLKLWLNNLLPLAGMIGLLLSVSAAQAQGYHADEYPALGQNPGNLNQDMEERFRAPAAPAGWTSVYQFSRYYTGQSSRGLVLPAGFDFRFNGQTVRAVRAYEQYLKLDTLQTSGSKEIWYGALPQSPQASLTVARILTKTFGTAPHRQFWVQWNSIPVGSSIFTGTNYAYVSVVLEETSNRVFVVFQRTLWPIWGQVPPIYIAGTRMQLSATRKWAADTLHPLIPYQNDVTVADNHTVIFEPGPRPAVDAALARLHLLSYLPSATGAPATRIRGTIINNGTQPLLNWQMHYSLDGGTIQTTPVISTVVAPGDTASFQFASIWNRRPYGEHQVRAWVTVGGSQPDAIPQNDTITREVHVASREVTRRVLEELATSSTCNPCAIYDDSVRAYARRHPERRLERIGYPMDFPGTGDPYYLPEFKARMMQNMHGVRNVYLYQSLGTPLMIDNGYFYVDATDHFTAPPMPPYDSLVTVLETPASYLEISGTCQASGTTLQGAVTLTPTRYLPARLYSLQLVITERRTSGNARSSGVTEFFDVAKKILPSQLLTVPLLPEQPQTFSFSYNFPAGHTVEHFDSLEVAAFVQFTQPIGTPTPAEVLQVARLRQGQPLAVGAPATATSGFALAPNPAAGGSTILYLTLDRFQTVNVEVFDALGRVVMTRPAESHQAGIQVLPLNLTAVPHGLYVVRVRTGSTMLTQRLVVE